MYAELHIRACFGTSLVVRTTVPWVQCKAKHKALAAARFVNIADRWERLAIVRHGPSAAHSFSFDTGCLALCIFRQQARLRPVGGREETHASKSLQIAVVTFPSLVFASSFISQHSNTSHGIRRGSADGSPRRIVRRRRTLQGRDRSHHGEVQRKSEL